MGRTSGGFVYIFLETVAGNSQKDFWLSRPLLRMEGAPHRVNYFMSHSWLDKIPNKLTFTDEFPPFFVKILASEIDY